ncbi:MAG: lysophospholipid acyltransferase family protein [Candidatus Eisenbacteria bacterium]
MRPTSMRNSPVQDRPTAERLSSGKCDRLTGRAGCCQAPLPMMSELKWQLARALMWDAGRGSLSAASRRTRRLARGSRFLLRWHWGWARHNLRLVYGPELAERELDTLARLSIESHFLSVLEGYRARELEVRLTTSEALERLREITRGGSGGIVVALHLGGWEAGIRELSRRGLPVTVVYQPPADPRLEAAFAAARAGSEIEWIPLLRPLHAVRALQRGRLLALMLDSDLGNARVQASFLGVSARLPAGVARLALRFGVPIIPALAARVEDGVAELRVGEPIFATASLDAAAAETTGITTRVCSALEPWVHEFAEQYDWTNPVWRDRPDGRRWTLREPIESHWRERETEFSAVSVRVRRLIAPASSIAVDSRRRA